MSWTDDYIAKRDKVHPGFKKGVETEIRKLNIAVEIHNLREREGLTQRELAAKVGKPQSTIARIETGQMLPSFKLVDEIAAALNKEVKLSFL